MADTVVEAPIYRALMRIKPAEIATPNAWAVKAGVSRMFFSDAKKGSKPTREKLAKVLAVAGWTVERFEAESGAYAVETEVVGTGVVGRREIEKLEFGDRALAALPLYGSAQGADMDDDFETVEVDLNEVLDYLQRPASLADDKESYALTVVGTSMKPRFKPRERVGVSPRATIDIGDDVIVQLRGENTNRVRRVLIKELVKRGPDYVVLRQYPPPRELQINRSDILAMHKVGAHYL